MRHILALVLDPSCILTFQGLKPDPWQQQLLLSRQRCMLLNCARQAGKSTTVAALGLHQAMIQPQALVLLVAPSERQSQELFRKVLSAYQALGRPVPAVKENQGQLELVNGARIIALPGCEETIRSFSGVSLLIIDEAARVPEEMYRAVRPMLAVSRGRLLALSTPFGRRGWFYHEWAGQGPWQRVQLARVPAHRRRLHRRGSAGPGAGLGRSGVWLLFHRPGRPGVPGFPQGLCAGPAAAGGAQGGGHRFRLAQSFRRRLGGARS